MLKWLTHTVCLHAFHILFHLIWKFGFEKKKTKMENIKMIHSVLYLYVL